VTPVRTDCHPHPRSYVQIEMPKTSSPSALSVIGATLHPAHRHSRRRLYIPPSMRATRRAPGPVAVLPLGQVAPSDLELIDEVVSTMLGARTLRLPEAGLPPAYFDRTRGQFDADRLLELLFDQLPDGAMRIVGVLDADMFAAGRTFVFGYAHLRDGVAVYSVARLREEWYGRGPDDAKLHARSYRALAHELGHTFGNPHCEEPGCVMRAVSQIESLDALGPSYCASCLRRVRRGLGVGPQSAEGQFLRAGALLRRRYLPRAIETYRRATERAPLEPRYFNDLGVALLAAADREGARAAFRRATELSADFPHPYYNLGILCREDGGADAAERFFTEGLRRDGDPLAAHRYLGKLYEDLFGDTLRARRHYLAYLQLGGGDAEVVSRVWAIAQDV
jgi:archaemetzincin